MCSIPGLPMPGTEVPVLITRVNPNSKCGLVELWVNMDDGRAHIYDQMREDIQIPKRRFSGSEGKPGDLCLVCISDTWHRARIESLQNETYSVFLIDQGQPHITSSEALAWGHCDSFVLPPEIESCILANVLYFENNRQFLMSLPGKKFQGLVQHVLMPDRIILLDIPTVSEDMCNCGVAKKIPADEFKCLVLKCLHLPKGEDSEADHITQEENLSVSYQLEKHDQYFYPELLTDTFETVMVTEVNNPGNIYCKLRIFSKAVEMLSEQIQQYYEKSSDLREAQPQICGDPCAARGLNGRWHRSLLKQNMTNSGAVEVLHVDEGKTELVPAGDIKPLHQKFLRMPVVTYPCSLDSVRDGGTGWTPEQTDYLKSQLLHQTVDAKFGHHSILQDVYYVTLYAANSVDSCFKEKAPLFPPKTDGDLHVLNEPIPSSFPSQINTRVDCLLEEILPTTQHQAVNGRTDSLAVNGNTGDVSTSVADDIHAVEHPDPVGQNNRHPSTGFPSKMQEDRDNHVLTIGSSVNVNISCTENLQKFWCQIKENGDSLRLLMQDLQNHYAYAHPQPFVESICVARNPDNDMWYRAKMIASHHSPVVDVRFIDYGQTRKVPLQDVRPIDPAFLQLSAQAFQCCLFSLKNPTNPAADPWTDSAFREFQKFVDGSASSNLDLKCTIKAVMSDEEGLLLNVVDIETPSCSACMHLAQTCAQDEAHVQIPPQVLSDAYCYSTHNIEVGGKEKVWVTSSADVNHFYCQLDRNSHLLEKIMENVQQHIVQSQCIDRPLGPNSICFARYTDNQWYRGQVVEVSPKLKVHFVDYGTILIVNESDICTFPADASIAMSVPVQAVPLGLYNIPTDIPQEVNQWFTDHALDHSFTISVVEKGAKGKLIVELFDGSLNVNVIVRERISQMKQPKISGLVKQTDQWLSNSSKHALVSNGDSLTQELIDVSLLTTITDQNKVCNSSNGTCAKDELKKSSQFTTSVFAPETEQEKTLLVEERKRTLNVILEEKETVLAETFIQHGHSDSEMTQHFIPSCLKENVNNYMYKRPNLSLSKTEEVYASCIVGPDYFWCQYTNTEDLNMVLQLAQEVEKEQNDSKFAKTLDPGSPCLALFSSDNQWYRAQVVQRTESTIKVLFIDYGNESDIDIKNVRSLPQNLLEKAPQAFLCSLYGFDESKGSWNDDVYDDFYNLLVDKPLRVTVLNMEDHPGIVVPHYAVQIECENTVVNNAMQKYWKAVTTEEITENPQTENLLQDGQSESDMTHLSVSKGNVNPCIYKNPNFSKNKNEEVFASCIVEPHYFWCQCANTEELDSVSRLAQETGQTQQDITVPNTLGPGSPCLALFPRDEQWYRAQVIHKVDDTFHVVFIDYGNESDVDVKNVKPLPQSLLEKAPQAFLCSLNGFDRSKGSWIDEVYEDFYSLLVDKPLKLTVFNREEHSEIAVPQYAVEIECEGVVINAAMQKYWKPLGEDSVLIGSPQTATFNQTHQTESNMTHLNDSEGNTNSSLYKGPKISINKIETVYASCIVEPHFFWSQFTDPEELNEISRLAQEAGQTQQDLMFPKTLGSGSPCLALFSSDKQWYRAQVINRVDDTFHVLFIDYGNESNVDIKNVKPLPKNLLEHAPQAFLCSLNGFDQSKGFWVDEVYEDFYSLLVDKPLTLTAFNMEYHSEIAVPQYSVQIECEGMVVNTLMEKFWRGLNRDHTLTDNVVSVDRDDVE